MLRESCFYRRLTDTSKDEENQEESEELQEDMLGGFLWFFLCHKFAENIFCVDESLEINNFRVETKLGLQETCHLGKVNLG